MGSKLAYRGVPWTSSSLREARSTYASCFYSSMEACLSYARANYPQGFAIVRYRIPEEQGVFRDMEWLCRDESPLLQGRVVFTEGEEIPSGSILTSYLYGVKYRVFDEDLWEEIEE